MYFVYLFRNIFTVVALTVPYVFKTDKHMWHDMVLTSLHVTKKNTGMILLRPWSEKPTRFVPIIFSLSLNLNSKHVFLQQNQG